jgi:hypothetical protein
MAAMQKEAQTGIQDLLKEQFALPGKLTVTVVEFDDKIETVVRLSNAPSDYTLVPRGSTALFDAVGNEIIATGCDLEAMNESDRPRRVIFVVVTDGQENASHEHKLETVKALIAKQKDEYKWVFQFIGAGEAAWQGQAMGMPSTRYSGDEGSTRSAYNVVSASLSNLRSNAEATDLQMPIVIP